MITFNTVDIRFNLRNKLMIRKWVKSIIAAESKLPGDIAYIFCSDDYLASINEQYMHHHTLTDIITFDYSESIRLSGDIFISIDRVFENAVKFGVSRNQELARVMAHGILHLAGYDDKSRKEKELMRSKEETFIPSFPNL